jgi:hypothetical protein
MRIITELAMLSLAIGCASSPQSLLGVAEIPPDGTSSPVATPIESEIREPDPIEFTIENVDQGREELFTYAIPGEVLWYPPPISW